MKADFYQDKGSEIIDVRVEIEPKRFGFAGNIFKGPHSNYRWFPNTDAANNPLDAEFLQSIVDKLNELNAADKG